MLTSSPSSCPLRPESLAQLNDEERAWLTGLSEKMATLERRAEAAEQRAEVAEQRLSDVEAVVKELTARLNQDSTNSHKPPSTDHKTRRPRRKRRKRGGKPGAKPGHKGHNRDLDPPNQLTSKTAHFPKLCAGCGATLSAEDNHGAPRPHQFFELPPIEMEVHQLDLHRRKCACGHITQASPPPQHQTGQGPRLTAFITALIGAFRLSRRQVQELLESLTGKSPALGSIQACWQRGAQAARPVAKELEKALPKQAMLNLDETSWKEAGKKRWLWVAAAEHFAVFAINTRGMKQVVEWKLLKYRGVVGCDRWNAYSRIVRKQVCWSHLDRDLEAIAVRDGAGQALARQMQVGVDEMFSAWWAFKDGKQSRSGLQSATAGFRASFKAFCVTGSAQEEDDRWRKLGKDLLKKWPHVFRFLDEEGVEPTNNHAERMLRPAVLWRRTSQGTRTEEGSRDVTTILTLVQSCRLQGRSAVAFLEEVVRAAWTGIPMPSLLPTNV